MQKVHPRFVGFLTIFIILQVLFVLYLRMHFKFRRCEFVINNRTNQVLTHSESKTVLLGTTVCGNQEQIKKALLMVKSAILFRGNLHVHFLIISTIAAQIPLRKELEIMKSKVKNTFTYELREPFFPKGNETFWRYWFAECATQRLFFPNIFPNVGKVVYVDTDVIFLNDLADIWQHTYKMNQSHMIAAGVDFINRKPGDRYANEQYPLYLSQNLNSGVLILDVKKMIKFGWHGFILKLTDIFGNITPTYPDQDLIRLSTLFFSDKLYLLSCKYNFHLNICFSTIPCKDVETDGVAIIHGAAKGYENIKEFKAIWSAFEKYKIGVEPTTRLLDLLNKKFENMKHKICKLSTTALSNNIRKMLSSPKNKKF